MVVEGWNLDEGEKRRREMNGNKWSKITVRRQKEREKQGYGRESVHNGRRGEEREERKRLREKEERGKE